MPRLGEVHKGMRVYRVGLDVNHYQYFLPERQADGPKLHGDCTRKADGWKPPPVYVYRPHLQAGDFRQWDGSTLIATPRATELLRTQFEMAGELLPLAYGGQEFTLLNVTECINCLDQEQTEWRVGPVSGRRVSPLRYAFHPNRFSESELFKIPETCRGEVLLVEGLHDPEEEFRHVVAENGLSGLKFTLLWSYDT